MRFKEWLGRHPVIAAGLAVAAILLNWLPQWAASTWALFSSEPLLLWLSKHHIPTLAFSPAWITGPISISLLVAIFFLLWNNGSSPRVTRVHESVSIPSSQVRPWVIVESLKLRQPITLEPNRFFLDFEIALTNSGSSPAQSVYAWLRVATMKVEILDKTWNKVREDYQKMKEDRRAEYESREILNAPFGYVIAPGKSVSQSFGCGGPGMYEETPSVEEVRTGAFFVLGYLEYVDQTGKTHYTRFSFIPDGDSVRLWDLSTFIVYPGYQDAN